MPTAARPRIDLLPNVSALEGIFEAGTRTYSYVVSFGDFSVLIDFRDESLLGELRQFPPPRHLFLTHRHIRKNEAAVEQALGLAVWIHPDDAWAPRRGPAEGTPYASAYHDPSTGELAALGFRFLHVPGHTPGCGFAFLDQHGGLLFTGDAVIGRKPDEPPGIELPPDWTCDDTARARESVAALRVPSHRSILPSHGEPIVDAEPGHTRRLWEDLQRELATRRDRR